MISFTELLGLHESFSRHHKTTYCVVLSQLGSLGLVHANRSFFWMVIAYHTPLSMDLNAKWKEHVFFDHVSIAFRKLGTPQESCANLVFFRRAFHWGHPCFPMRLVNDVPTSCSMFIIGPGYSRVLAFWFRSVFFCLTNKRRVPLSK